MDLTAKLHEWLIESSADMGMAAILAPRLAAKIKQTPMLVTECGDVWAVEETDSHGHIDDEYQDYTVYCEADPEYLAALEDEEEDDDEGSGEEAAYFQLA